MHPRRMDILPPPQKRLWPDLVVVKDEGFVLYGGTAIALYLGHRQSVDFDFFTHYHFQPDDLLAKFSCLRGGEILQVQVDTLTLLVPRGDQNSAPVKISFFGGLSFGRLDDPVATDDNVLDVASMVDLLAHKLKVLMQRVDPRDYQDIDALLQSGLDLATGLGGARALFAAFAPQECLKALTYFDDVPVRDLPDDLKHRLLKATRSVSEIPPVSVKATTLSDRGPPSLEQASVPK